ncbi:MAG: succinate dehydrogenase iron-sulfur subunit [uncultured bacterium]|nr:MAG: succinate dehydrogenase iron-sulfur subunit [uncultured bacterium]
MDKYHVKIKRDAGKSPYWEHFEASLDDAATLIQMLEELQRKPVNQKGEKVYPVAFESGCGKGVCGACTALVNGEPVLLCQTRVGQLPKTITIEPVQGFPVIRDLVVNREIIFENLTPLKMAPLLTDFEYKTNRDLQQSVQSQASIFYEACIQCGACLAVCPQYDSSKPFGGALVALAALESVHEKLDILVNSFKLQDCDNAQACVKACPKDIPLDLVWGQVKRAITQGFMKSIFG